jgi:phosphonate transport system substrate-binding protein
MKKESSLRRLAFLLFPLFCWLLWSDAAWAERLIFGVVPQQSAAELAKGWAPLLAALSARCGDELVFETATDIPTFERRLAAGEYDLAYMNPYHYVVFHQAVGYEALAKGKGAKLQGILVTRKDGPIQMLEQLQGQRVAFPAPAAFAATILPLASLKEKRIDAEPVFVGSHDSVYLGVARGFFPAGGGIRRTFEGMSPEIRDALRVFWTTPEYTSHAIAAHQRVPVALRARIQEALVAADSSPEGRELLAKAHFKGFEAGQDADWNDIRVLGVTVLDEVVKSVGKER